MVSLNATETEIHSKRPSLQVRFDIIVRISWVCKNIYLCNFGYSNCAIWGLTVATIKTMSHIVRIFRLLRNLPLPHIPYRIFLEHTISHHTNSLHTYILIAQNNAMVLVWMISKQRLWVGSTWELCVTVNVILHALKYVVNIYNNHSVCTVLYGRVDNF